MTDNQLSERIKRSRVDGPILLIQWLAKGDKPETPGTYFIARIKSDKLKHPPRVFKLFMPAPTNSRASVKVALMNHLDGFTQRHPKITCEETHRDKFIHI